MELQQIIDQLTKQFGPGLNVAQATKLLEGVDLKNIDMTQVINLLTKAGIIGDLDGDGKVESLADELKGVAEKTLGGGLCSIVGKILGGK